MEENFVVVVFPDDGRRRLEPSVGALDDPAAGAVAGSAALVSLLAHPSQDGRGPIGPTAGERPRRRSPCRRKNRAKSPSRPAGIRRHGVGTACIFDFVDVGPGHGHAVGEPWASVSTVMTPAAAPVRGVGPTASPPSGALVWHPGTASQSGDADAAALHWSRVVLNTPPGSSWNRSCTVEAAPKQRQGYSTACRLPMQYIAWNIWRAGRGQPRLPGPLAGSNGNGSTATEGLGRQKIGVNRSFVFGCSQLTGKVSGVVTPNFSRLATTFLFSDRL
jgi:hypothetical protein